MLTKPAAVFAQLLGALTAFAGIVPAVEDGNYLWALAGAALFIWGGWSARARIKREARR